MRIITVMDVDATAPGLGFRVAQALALSDTVVAVCHRGARRARGELSALVRRGARMVIFDEPAREPWPARLETICRNLRRHFRPDALLLLEGPEFLACESRPILERTMAARTRLRGVRLARYRAPAPAVGAGAPPPSFAMLTQGAPAGSATGRLLSAADLDTLDAPPSSPAAGPLRSAPDESVATIALVALESAPTTAGETQAPVPPPVPARREIAPEDDHVYWTARAIGTPDSDAAGSDLATGILGPSFHLAQFYLDLPPFRHLADRSRPASVLDVGCGLGGYLAAFDRWGARDLHGVDGFAATADVLCGDAYACHDLRRPLDLGRTFDLVISTEVVEHVPPAHEAVVLDTIQRHARELILFSAAVPGQEGIGHVNCRPMAHWLEAWWRRGWEPDVLDSLAVRSLGTYHWFRRNLLVLRPRGRGPAADGYGVQDLVSHEAAVVRWTAQRPAIHVYPLGEPLGDGAEPDAADPGASR